MEPQDTEIEEKIRVAEAAITSLREAIHMIDVTEAEYADQWPPLERTQAGALLINQLPEMVLAIEEVEAGIAQLRAGVGQHPVDGLAHQCDLVARNTQLALAVAVREINRQN